ATGDDKTSILFAVKHRAGALHRVLTAFKGNKINLTRIESRPSRMKAWEYLFFVDIEGHCEQAPVKRALADMEKQCIMCTVLGSYPRVPTSAV
ncbi:MAG: prephenate dehydratase, partial [Kiritimatiellia bacterium]|nr:ACT domain-containing protein [Lentisphaerota bacterium]